MVDHLPVLFPLHDLDTLHVRAVHFEPHLHRHSGKLVTQQNCCVDGRVSLSDVDDNAGERVARFEPYKEDGAWLHVLGIVWIEKINLLGYHKSRDFALIVELNV